MNYEFGYNYLVSILETNMNKDIHVTSFIKYGYRIIQILISILHP